MVSDNDTGGGCYNQSIEALYSAGRGYNFLNANG